MNELDGNSNQENDYPKDLYKRITDLENKVEALQKYEAFFHHTPLPFIIINAKNGEVVDVNDAFLQVTESKDKQIIGNTTSDSIISKESSLKIANSYRKTNQVKDVEIEFKDSKNNTKYISVYLFHKKLNNEAYNFSSFVDITEKKIINKLLKESEENYKNLADFAPFGIIINSKNKLLYINQLASDIIGLNNTESIIGKSLLDVVHKDSVKFVKERMLKKIADSATLIEEKFVRSNGDVIWIELTAKNIIYFGHPSVIVFFRDISKRISLLNSIRERDEKIRLIYESSIDAIIQTNNEGDILLFNHAAESLFKYKAGEILYKNISDLIDFNNLPQKSILSLFYKNQINNQIKKGVRGEQFFKRKDGTAFLGDISIFTGNTDNGIYVVATIKDITEIKADKLKLEESEKNYRLLVETMNDGVIKTDLDYKIMFANSRAAEILGYSLNELIEKNGYEILFSQEEIDFIKNKNRLFNLSDNYEIRLKKKDGSFIWVLISGSLIYDSKNIVGGYIAVFSDVTLKKTTEFELRHYQQFLERIIENIPVSLVVKDAKTGVFKIWNKTAEKMFGIPKSEAIGKTDYDFFKKEQADIFTQKDLEVFVQTEPVEIDEQYIDIINKKTRIITHTIKVPLLNEKGLPESVIVFSEDITERKHNEDEKNKLYEDLFQSKRILEENSQNIMKLNKELSESEKKLKDSLNAKNKFFGIIAHDLRSPITGFLQLTKLLTEEINNITLSELNEISRTIYLSADKLYKLLENLLEWSFIQQDQIIYSPKKLNLLEAINDVFQYFDQLAKDKKISIDTNISPEICIFSDPNMFETIIRNLISNAIKFSYESSIISINYNLSNEEPDKYIISVKDSGIGISNEFIPYLFKIEKKLQKTGTKSEDGSGLGLILTKEFVERNGGKIWVESKQNEGSTFFFTVNKYRL